MIATIYILCAGTALFCSYLLFRGYKQSQNRLLFWSALCFAILVLDNLFLFYDHILIPEIDIIVWRSPIALIAVCFLLYGLIFEKK